MAYFLCFYMQIPVELGTRTPTSWQCWFLKVFQKFSLFAAAPQSSHAMHTGENT
jgi:hypothetical protein